MKNYASDGKIGTNISKRRLSGFKDDIKRDSATVGLRLDEIDGLLKLHQKQRVRDLDGLTLDIKDEDLRKSAALRYVRDRQESKRQ